MCENAQITKGNFSFISISNVVYSSTNVCMPVCMAYKVLKRILSILFLYNVRDGKTIKQKW